MANNIIDSFLILFTTQVRGNGIQQLNKQTAGVMKNMSGAGNMLKMFFGYDLYTTVRQLIPSLVDASKQMGAMESRFYAITNSSKLAGQELEWVKNQADRLGLEFLKTADSYSIFYSSVAKTMGGDVARNIFQNWAEAFRVLHIDPAKQERVLYALREMSSKGKIYLQDLSNQLGSHIPAAMQIAAKSMGYVGKDAVQRFRKDITAGTVDVQKFLIVFSEAMNGAYVSSEKLANAMEKPDAQLGRLAGRWQRFLIAVSKGGFEKDLVNTLKGVNFLLGGLEKHGVKVYGAIKNILKVLVVLFSLKGLNFLLFNAPKLLITLQAIFASSTAFLIFLERTIIKIIGLQAWKLIFALFSGPAGWTIGIIALLGFILHKFFPNVEKSLIAMLVRAKVFLWRLFFDLKKMFDESPMGKYMAEKYKSTNIPEKEKTDIYHKNEAGRPIIMGVDVSGGNSGLKGLDQLTNLFNRMGKASPQTTSQKNKMDVKITFESKGEIPEEQFKALKDNVGTTFLNSIDVILNSKQDSRQPKYLPLTPLRRPI